jgi:serine O-acetyltransferase
MMIQKMFADYARLFAITKGPKLVKAVTVLFMPSLHIMLVHRMGYAVTRLWLPLRWPLLVPYAFLRGLIHLAYNVSVPARATIGGGCVLLHPCGTVIHPGVRIGRNVTLGCQVVLGIADLKDDRVPEIGDEVVVFAGAKVLGPAHVFHHAVVGANAVVCSDVPAYGEVGGVPARVLRVNQPQQQQRRRHQRFPRRQRNDSNVRVYNDKREGVIHV